LHVVDFQGWINAFCSRNPDAVVPETPMLAFLIPRRHPQILENNPQLPVGTISMQTNGLCMCILAGSAGV
jgi:hypothetical protein